MRVAVVGAGFAGLAAADELRRGGAEAVVLEARDRVGGRVWSRELPNGAVVEMGAEFVLPRYTVMRQLVDRFGLGLWDKGMAYGDREPRGGPPTSREEILAGGEAIAAALAAPGARGRSAADLLDQLPLQTGAREAIRARLEISCAAPADRVSAVELAGLGQLSREPCPSVAGGNQRVALALAAELGSSVHLSSPVERVAWTDDGVRVGAAGVEVEADRCLIAVPATVLDRIAFDPAIPEPMATALAGIEYGHAAKLFVPLETVAPPSAVMAVPERYWCWTANGADGPQPVVSCFSGSAEALARLAVERGPATWLSSLMALRNDLALEPEGAVLSTWDDDPWAAAAYSVAALDGPDTETLCGPVGPLVFAGEHTAGEYASLMEGALRSGVRAARQLLAG